MAWTDQVDGYCERLDFSFWAEPINAITNAAFLIAAIAVFPAVRRAKLPIGVALCAILFAIGTGSFLFHTFATGWAGAADVIPIVLFVLLYIFAANLHFWNMKPWVALLATLGFFPFAAVVVPLADALGFMGSSVPYAPVPILIALYAIALRNRAPKTARGLGAGAAILCLSLAARTVDEPLCHAIPHGTHFLWHCLNALMLGWMIEVYRRHMLAERAARG